MNKQKIKQSITNISGIDNVEKTDSYPVNNKLIILILFFTGSLIGILLLIIFSQRNNIISQNQTSLIPSPIISTSPTQQPIITTVLTPTISLPDFSKENVKPKTNIDISNWRIFNDPEVGLRFKYPPEWGNIKKEYKKSLSGDSGDFYCLTFSNSRFQVGGCDDKFGSGPVSHLFFSGLSKDWEGCDYEYNKDLILCKETPHRVDVMGGDPCGIPLYPSYARLMLLDRPEKKYQV